ncbi:MAG: family 20 glycosylhydrolase [Acidobacteriota bacterium]|nr:family 20 glycosylhydrolase [Acidobacteriota bacterium]
MTAHASLAPPPRELELTGGHGNPPDRPGFDLPEELIGSPAHQAVAERLVRRGHAAPRTGAEDAWLRVRRVTNIDLPPEGYELRHDADGVDIVAPQIAGLRHGLTTMSLLLGSTQSLRTGDRVPLPRLHVRDWPAIENRGLMLDISRNKVPTNETLERLVDQMAELKLNQLQLYTEHTFAYTGHERVWENASALMPEDVRHLGRYCADRGIELVPNQQSFGHFHRWLVHEPYRSLAECPDGVVHSWSRSPEPFSLCPTDPGSLELLEDLYGQLLPLFESRLFNVGLDETFDIGQGRSRSACERSSRGAVYLDFLRAVHERVSGSGHRMMFWGDIVVSNPAMARQLPTDAIALLWGYEADHPFAEQAALVAEAGMEFYVCPGTSSWNSFSGRWTNARENCARAALAAMEHGATGYLIADWGDNGHLQPLTITLPGLVAGAAFSWNPEAATTNSALPMEEALDSTLMAASQGRALLELGDAYRTTRVQLVNGTVAFRLLMSLEDPLTQRGLQRLTLAELEAARSGIDDLKSSIGPARLAGPGEELVRRELHWTCAILDLAYDLGALRVRQAPEGRSEDLPAGDRRRLATDLEALTDEREELWLARNRPGGWDDTRARLAEVHALLAAG